MIQQPKRLKLAEAWEAYFGIADELDGGLELSDLELSYIYQGRMFATKSGAPWPPELWWAEEFNNDLCWGGRGFARKEILEEVKNGQD